MRPLLLRLCAGTVTVTNPISVQWLAYPSGKVRHAFKANPFNPDYLWSACGLLCGNGYAVERRRMRKCKTCGKAADGDRQ